jgi:hypothetical protein
LACRFTSVYSPQSGVVESVVTVKGLAYVSTAALVVSSRGRARRSRVV